MNDGIELGDTITIDELPRLKRVLTRWAETDQFSEVLRNICSDCLSMIDRIVAGNTDLVGNLETKVQELIVIGNREWLLHTVEAGSC